jgi:hypothetical protein
MDWATIWNRTFKLIDSAGAAYCSGPRFIRAVQELEIDFRDYGDYIKDRNKIGKSTTRRLYFRDIFLGLTEAHRFKLTGNILRENEGIDPKLCAEIRKLFGGGRQFAFGDGSRIRVECRPSE